MASHVILSRCCGLCLLLVLVGCGEAGYHQVEGTVTRGGQPFGLLQITFDPDDPELGRPPIAVVGKDGKFKMTSGTIIGVKQGSYTVHIDDPERVGGGRTSTEPDYLHVIDRYSAAKSDLKINVDRNMKNYELKLDD